MPDKGNDCVSCIWWTTWACDGDLPDPCGKLLTIEDKDYADLSRAYEDDIEIACAPVREQWKYIFEDYYK